MHIRIVDLNTQVYSVLCLSTLPMAVSAAVEIRASAYSSSARRSLGGSSNRGVVSQSVDNESRVLATPSPVPSVTFCYLLLLLLS